MFQTPSRYLAAAVTICGIALVATMPAPAAAEGVVRVHGHAQSPPPAPVITSTGPNVFVSGSATNLVGTPGQFTISDPGGSDVVGYLYGFSPSPDIPVAASSAGKATLTIASYNGSEFDLYVSAKNGSGQIGQPSKFQIETILPAGNVAALAWWKLNSGHGNRADDSTGHGHLAKLSGHASLRCGSKARDSYRCWLSLAPSGGQAVTSKTVLPIVGNNGSFAVSAWVRVAACAAACVALSEDATKTSGFTLSYQRSCAAGGHTGACWRFSMPKTDSKSAFVYRASSSPGTAHVSKWVELTGVFNASHGALTLYVNGVEAGQVTGAAPWTAPAPGPVRLGRMLASGPAAPWDGQISNVCIFYGVLQPADIKLLYSGNSTYPHNGCAALHARYSQ